MKRRLQLVGLVAVPLGAIAFAAVALVLVVGLQQQLADATVRVDRLEAEAAALEPRVLGLEDAPTSLDAVQPVLSAQRFRLVDDSGLERAALQMEADGPSLRVFDAGGESQIFVGVTDTGPELTVNGPGLPASSARATLKLNANGLPHLDMVDLEGRSRTALALSSASGNGDGFLRFWDQDGDRRLLVGVRDDSPEVVLTDRDDVPRAKLSADRNGPILRFHDDAGNVRADIGLSRFGGPGIVLRGDDEEQLAAFFADRFETSLSFFGPRGQVRSVLKSNDEDSSLFLFDAQGTIGASLGITGAVRGVTVADGDGNLRATMAVSENDPTLAFADATGAVLAALGLTEFGPTLEFADVQGTVRAHLSHTAGGTNLILQDEQSKPAALLSVTDAGRVLGLFDESGTVRTSAGYTPEGSAFELYDAEGTVRAKLDFTTGGPALSLHDEARTTRVFAGFLPSTPEPFIATLDEDLNVIWRSDSSGDLPSESETTAGAGR